MGFQNLLTGPSGGANAIDPRASESAQVIDLATRNVLPQVSQQVARSGNFSTPLGLGIVALLGAGTFWSMEGTRQTAVAPPQARAKSVYVTPVQPGPHMTAPMMPLQTPVMPRSVMSAPPVQTVMPQSAPLPRANPYLSPSVVFDSSAAPSPTGATLPSTYNGPGSPNDDFASRIGGVGGGPAVASAAMDPKTTVTQGTLIPAVLETAIDTDVPGFVRAVVSADVRSFDGGRVLVPRSSRLIGQYKSGLQTGQKRVYIIWTRLIRPDGISVNIASPAVGFGGETGLAGKVNTHFFERFGSAMLLSVVGGLSTLGGGGLSLVAGGGVQSAAATAVGQTGQIGPTIRVRQGEPIRVFTARDLDFSKVSSE